MIQGKDFLAALGEPDAGFDRALARALRAVAEDTVPADRQSPARRLPARRLLAVAAALALIGAVAATAKGLNLFSLFGRMEPRWARVAEDAELDRPDRLSIETKELGASVARIDSAYFDGQSLVIGYAIENYIKCEPFSPTPEQLADMESVIGETPETWAAMEALEAAMAAGQPYGYVEYAIKMADECATDDGIALLCGAWTGQPTPEGSIDCLWELESPMPETLQSRERLALRLTLCLQTTRFYFDGSECHVLKSLRPVGELTATAERSESVIRAYAGSASLGGVPLRAEATVSAIHAALTLTARDGLLADADAWRPFLLTDADTGEAFDLEFSQLEPDSAMAEFAGIGHVPERLLLSIVAEEEASGDAPRLLNDQPILLKP